MKKTSKALKSAILKLLKLLKYVVSRAMSIFYDWAISYPVTMKVYNHMVKERFLKDFPLANPTISMSKSKTVSMIDIGTGPGTCLNNILNKVNFERVLAVDIDKDYVASAKTLFKDRINVEVRLQDLETYFEDGNTEQFDIVFFGFSFMLMPNKAKALEVARRMVKPNGKIYACLTLYENKNKFVEWIKPKIKFLTSIDFGPVIYRKQVRIYNLEIFLTIYSFWGFWRLMDSQLENLSF
jgi:ubiquinone/menaquinone biosynthesis C-methylase UbiE